METVSLPKACWSQARQVLRTPASFSKEVVQAAYKWVNRPCLNHVRDVSTCLGIVAAEPVAALRRQLPSVRRRAEELVTRRRIDTLVDEWCLGIANPDDHVEVGWALRLRDRFGFPPASEPTRLSGERWVLKQLNGVDPESWNVDLNGVFEDAQDHFPWEYTAGCNAAIAQAAATLWLTQTLVDKALARHQDFRSLQ
nr:ORF1 [Fig umbra-like virus]WPY71388.1 ORF1 [Fig umbra-like virus]WPY71391.1 ORF1 [Fig umbra-like virus]WPY71394.1 ORF1 [Fig umbra-like virus]WPY71397.1 ORF1 [Fig umbra-like virus]